MALTDKRKVEMYQEMVLIRKFEEVAAEKYEEAKIRGFLHLYIGQEAVATGFMEPLRADDYVVGSYRDHGQALSRCADPRAVMAELYGKSTGVSKGKGGSMHLFSKQHRFLGGTAIVGGSLPLAAGAGFAINYSSGDQVVLCFFGDGAINEGAFHETLNLAALWNLPIIFICENNRYGMGTHVERASAVPALYRRAQCYAMEVESVDGMDLIAVYELADRVIRNARQDKRPIFVEAVTYRYRGHSMADPGQYRTKQEIEEWRRRDPIIQFANHLVRDGIVTSEQLDKINADVDQQIQQAVQFAEDSPFPDQQALWQDVYA